MVFVCLTALRVIISRPVPVAANNLTHSFYDYIPWDCIFFAIELLMDTEAVPCLGFIHSFTMIIGVCVSFHMRDLSGYVPRKGIAGSDGDSIFSF